MSGADRAGPGRARHLRAAALACLLVVILVAGGVAVVAPHPPASPAQGGSQALSPLAGVETLRATARAEIPEASSDRAPAGSVDLGTGYPGPLTAILALRSGDPGHPTSPAAARPFSLGVATGALPSPSGLPLSPAPNGSGYELLVGFLRSFGAVHVTTSPDRLSVVLSGPAPVLAGIFGTPIDRFELGSIEFAAPVRAPTLPEPLAGSVAGIAGLGTGPAGEAVRSVGGTVVDAPASALPAGSLESPAVGSAPAAVPGYPVPPNVSGIQRIYPTDMQVAYDELSLFATSGPSTRTTVATILWSGQYNGSRFAAPGCGTINANQSVGPYDPEDIATFFNQTDPGQPAPVVKNLNISGAAAGCPAAWDSTGVVVGNTAQVEAIASTAPGATVWVVSVSGPNLSNLDAALAEILSPPSTLPASDNMSLHNVTIVDVGWAFPDQNDPVWLSLLASAESRGVTVVTATGDSGDSPLSSAWTGNDVSFPSSAATSSAGSVAVGGTTVALNPSTLHLAHQAAWYSPQTSPTSATRGSSGGTSTVFPAPSWQNSSLANSVIAGKGRGAPDVAALANNTLVTVSINGALYKATNATTGGPFVAVNGTGLAAAFVTGLLGEIDQVLTTSNAPPLGFADRFLYAFATEEYSPLSAPHIPASPTYTSSLPTLPFADVTKGKNAAFSAAVGYDLVTGWGSIDAYNYTMYLLPPPSTPTWGRLQGVEDFVNLTGLSVQVSGGTPPPPQDSASIQQNLFVANALGAPVYWVQSVTTLAFNSTAKDWAVDFQGWVILPFWGLYPGLAVYEYAKASAVTETLPLPLALETLLISGTASIPASIDFAFGGGAGTLSLPLPGASYIIGSANHTYSWQGTNYTNGPNGSSAGGNTGFLAPQFGLVGYPGGATATFLTGTAGTVEGFVEALGGVAFERAGTGLVTPASTQTGETAVDLSYAQTAPNAYSFAYASGAGTAEQGIYLYEVPHSAVVFTQTGVPSRTTWYVNITGTLAVKGSALGTVTSMTFELPNGSYRWAASTDSKNVSSIPRAADFNVTGASQTIALSFGQTVCEVTFQAYGFPLSGPPPFTWYINLTNGPSLSSTTLKLNATVLYGTHGYHVADSNKSWKPLRVSSTFYANSANLIVNVKFVPVTYVCELVFELPGGIAPHMTVRIGPHHASGYFVTYSARLQNGTYRWSVSNLSGGDTAAPTFGTFHVDGPGPAASQGKYVVVVKITAPSDAGLFGLGTWGFAMLLGMAGAGALLVALVLLLRRRTRREKEGPPPNEVEEEPTSPTSVFDEPP